MSDKTANNFLEDRELVEAVKVDDLAGIQSLLKNDIKKTTRTLSYGFPGNTLLHEAIQKFTQMFILFTGKNR